MQSKMTANYAYISSLRLALLAGDDWSLDKIEFEIVKYVYGNTIDIFKC